MGVGGYKCKANMHVRFAVGFECQWGGGGGRVGSVRVVSCRVVSCGRLVQGRAGAGSNFLPEYRK